MRDLYHPDIRIPEHIPSWPWITYSRNPYSHKCAGTIPPAGTLLQSRTANGIGHPGTLFFQSNIHYCHQQAKGYVHQSCGIEQYHFRFRKQAHKAHEISLHDIGKYVIQSIGKSVGRNPHLFLPSRRDLPYLQINCGIRYLACSSGGLPYSGGVLASGCNSASVSASARNPNRYNVKIIFSDFFCILSSFNIFIDTKTPKW